MNARHAVRILLRYFLESEAQFTASATLWDGGTSYGYYFIIQQHTFHLGPGHFLTQAIVETLSTCV